jgi:DNA processing protein
MDRSELAGWLRLSLSPGVGNVGARRLLAAFGLPGQVFSASAATLEEVCGPAAMRGLVDEPPELAPLLDATWQWLQGDEGGVPRRVITLGDPLYPPSLLSIEDPPLLLYAMGRLELPWPRAVAIVGSRNATPQGLDNARQFAASFARAGLCVVSGLALGIDGAAHEGALAGAGPDAAATFAVVGTGLDRVYPKRHLALARRIVQAGAILSEYPIGTPPLAQNFPKRNRLISGLSLGTLVVEAALESGSLITARMAGEQGREVFAIPGSIHSPQARGCHALIRQGAKLVETAQDVLEELPGGMLRANARPVQADLVPAPRDALLDALGHDPVTLDALVARTGIDAARLQAQLLEHELEGRVARMPGGLFQRRGSA